MLNRTIGRDSYIRLEILHRFGGSLLALIEGMRVCAGFSTARTSAVMLVTSKGAASVSGGSFVVFAATVTAIGVLPMVGLALAYTVCMSMAIATCNTIGDSVATVMVRSGWGEFTEQTAKAEYSRVFGRNPEAAL
jgi:hypothetical protein